MKKIKIGKSQKGKGKNQVDPARPKAFCTKELTQPNNTEPPKGDFNTL